MIEKVKAVNNPLTIIAIFAALAEIAGTVALKLVNENLQTTFIWFVMLFPALLVLLFFLTLNFNPKVLYAPSDFRNEENFLNAIYGVNRLSISLDEVQKQLEGAKSQIVEATAKSIGIANENERKRLIQIVEDGINAIQDKVESTRESAEEVALNASSVVPKTPISVRVLELLKKEGREMKGGEILSRLNAEGVSQTAIISNLRKLTEQKKLVRTSENNKFIYRLNDGELSSRGNEGK